MRPEGPLLTGSVPGDRQGPRGLSGKSQEEAGGRGRGRGLTCSHLPLPEPSLAGASLFLSGRALLEALGEGLEAKPLGHHPLEPMSVGRTVLTYSNGRGVVPGREAGPCSQGPHQQRWPPRTPEDSLPQSPRASPPNALNQASCWKNFLESRGCWGTGTETSSTVPASFSGCYPLTMFLQKEGLGAPGWVPVPIT